MKESSLLVCHQGKGNLWHLGFALKDAPEQNHQGYKLRLTKVDEEGQ